MKDRNSTNVFSPGYALGTNGWSILSRIAICFRVLRDTPCFRKDRANTGFIFCALHHALERTGQILRCLHVLGVNTGFIVYAIVSASRINSTGIDFIPRDIQISPSH